MLTWALVNLVLSGLALLFALVNKGAPHRLRFHVCFVAMLAWLVPWSLVPSWMPDLLSLDLWQMEQRIIATTARATTFPLIIVDTRSIPLASEMTFLHLPLLMLSALLFCGLCLFVWQLSTHHWRLRRLQRTAQDGKALWQQTGINSDVPVLLQTEISGAFSSGVLRPTIWVHSDLTRTPQLPTLLRHELTHIQQHDNAYLLAITLVEKLFWWNPLVSWLGRHTRQLQEHSCDERCRARNADYATHLAALMLANIRITPSRAQEPLSLSANIFNKPNLNIQRLKVLQRSHAMKPRHIVSSIATAVLAIVSVGLVTAQDQQTAPEDNVIFFRHGTAVSAAAEGVASFGTTTSDPESRVPGEHYNSVFGMHTTDGVDQFMKVDRQNDETVVTFSFTDAALPFVLGPLADMMGNPPRPGMAIAGVAVPAPGQRIEVRRLEGAPPGVVSVGEPGDVMFTAPIAVARSVELAEGEALPSGAPGEAARVVFARAAGAAEPFEFPISPNLLLEADNARERQVTVSGENLSVEAALEAIAAAANCNIFKDGDTVVVDFCEAQ